MLEAIKPVVREAAAQTSPDAIWGALAIALAPAHFVDEEWLPENPRGTRCDGRGSGGANSRKCARGSETGVAGTTDIVWKAKRVEHRAHQRPRRSDGIGGFAHHRNRAPRSRRHIVLRAAPDDRGDPGSSSGISLDDRWRLFGTRGQFCSNRGMRTNPSKRGLLLSKSEGARRRESRAESLRGRRCCNTTT